MNKRDCLIENAQLEAYCGQLRRSFAANLAICIVGRRGDTEGHQRAFSGVEFDERAYSNDQRRLSDAVMALLSIAQGILDSSHDGKARVLIEIDGRVIPMDGEVEHFSIQGVRR